jgi:MFS family permease
LESANPPIVAKGLAAPAVKLDQAGLIAEDLPCRHCGYNLRTLSLEVQCPECGTSVGRSVHGDYLRYADPAWVRGLATGAIIVIFGTIGQVLGFSTMLGISMAGISSVSWYRYFFRVIELISFVGFWKLTSPDPADSGAPAQIDARKLTRTFLILGLCLSSLGIIRAVLGSTMEHVLRAFILANAIASPIAICIFAKRVAMRVPDKKMATSCQRLMYLMVADGVLNGTVWVISLASVNGLSIRFLGVVSLINAIPAIAALFLSLVVLDRFRRAFTHAVRCSQDAQAPPAMATQGGIP